MKSGREVTAALSRPERPGKARQRLPRVKAAASREKSLRVHERGSAMQQNFGSLGPTLETSFSKTKMTLIKATMFRYGVKRPI